MPRAFSHFSWLQSSQGRKQESLTKPAIQTDVNTEALHVALGALGQVADQSGWTGVCNVEGTGPDHRIISAKGDASDCDCYDE